MVEKSRKPDWFDPKKYDLANSFSYKELFDQFLIRFMLINIEDGDARLLLDMFNNIKEYTYPDCIEAVVTFAQSLQMPTSLDEEDDNKLVYQSLWSMTTSEVAWNYSNIVNDVNALNLLNKNPSFEAPKGMDVFKINCGKVQLVDGLTDTDWLGRKSLTINLNAEKKELIKDFEKWVDESKRIYKKDSKQQKISPAKKSLWVGRRVLAYIDLLIWIKLEHKEMAVDTLLDWVECDLYFLTPIGDASDRRKRYKALFKEVTSYEFITRLFNFSYGDDRRKSMIEIINRFVKKHSIDLQNLT